MSHGTWVNRIYGFLVVFAVVNIFASGVFARTQDEILKEHDINPIEVQKALTNAGLYTGPIDGIFGRKTVEAIRQFQTERGLKVDGVLGLQTWDQLKPSLDSMPQEKAVEAPSSQEPSITEQESSTSSTQAEDENIYDSSGTSPNYEEDDFWYELEPERESNQELKQKLVS